MCVSQRVAFSHESVRKGFVFSQVENWIFSVLSQNGSRSSSQWDQVNLGIPVSTFRLWTCDRTGAFVLSGKLTFREKGTRLTLKCLRKCHIWAVIYELFSV